MSTPIVNQFTQYQQTEQEQLAGSTLSTDQKQFIQSQIALVAQSRLALVPDANNYASFIQTESHYKGQMDAYQYLLDCSDASEQQLLALAAAQNATS
jgi:hypothetical protein